MFDDELSFEFLFLNILAMRFHFFNFFVIKNHKKLSIGTRTESTLFVKMEDGIPIFIHNFKSSFLNGTVLIGDSMLDMNFDEIQDGFYMSFLFAKNKEEPVYLYLTTKGFTMKIEIDINSKKPFFFIDLSKERNIVDFNEFLSCFNLILRKKIININEENKLIFIQSFINAFENDYFVWAILFITCQNWESIFEYDEQLSEVVLNLVTTYINNNFFSKNKDKCNLKKYSPIGMQFQLYEHADISFKSSKHKIKYLIRFLNNQIGEQLTYLFMSCLDFDLYVLPLNSKKKRINKDIFNNILINFINLSNDEDDYMKIFTTFLSCCYCEDELILSKIINIAKININPVISSNIIRSRLFKSKPINNDNLKFIFKQLPCIEEILEIFSEDYFYVPFEWISCIKNASGVDNQLLFTLIANNSLKYSISKHLYSSFSKVTMDGELIFDKELNQQNNSISFDKSIKIKEDVKIGDNVLILKNTRIGTGTKIGSNCTIGKNVRIHSGVVIKSNEYIKHNFEIPIGFIYNRDVIEFSDEIPSIITKELFGFSKRRSGFIDLELLLDTYPCFLIEYFEKFSLYPYECGKEFAKMYEKIDKVDCFQEQFLHIFKEYTLLFVLGYWENMKTKVSDIYESLFKELCQTSLINFIKNNHHEIFNDEKTSELILKIITHLNILIEHEIEKELIDNFRKKVFDLCDDASVHLSLTSNENTAFILRNLQKILQIIV